jgi:hypothetical protein
MNDGDHLRVFTLTLEELAERYPAPSTRRSNWKANRRRNRALGLDRFGRPLARELGTNPRALGTNPRSKAA